VLLALLIAVNAFLIALLLRPEPEFAEPVAQGTEGGAPTVTPPANSTGPEPSSSPSNSSAPPPSSPPAKESPEVVPVKRLLAAASGSEAWRATVGNCNRSGSVERSTDGGETWVRVVSSGLAPIVRLGMDGTGDFYTIGGAGQECSATYTAYSDDGAIVASTDNPLNLWYSGPKDRDQVYGPGKTKATPCDEGHVVGLASLSLSDALVICTNGSAMVTSDSGKSWLEAGELPGAMAVASGGGRYWIAGASTKCDGISVRSLTASEGKLSRGPKRCAPAAQVTAGRVAIDVSNDTIWVWVGQKAMISTDGGQTWT
jgi:hypothetical protein